MGRGNFWHVSFDHVVCDSDEPERITCSWMEMEERSKWRRDGRPKVEEERDRERSWKRES